MNIVLGRTRVRRVLQTSLAVALVGGVVATGGTSAVAAPEKVLQSVAVSLGSDSTVRGVTSTTVRAGDGEELSGDSESLDPAAVADQLPVRVLTSYRLGDRAGTDLADIEGEAGRVVVDVTVQNVTARPEQLGYDFDGTQLRQNALVATPLTVVASADLGEDALGTVVTADDVAPSDVTNGVLGRGAGSAEVQWAALLAPPRLGSSATFRLVQDTDDFQVPTFDLSVQPGLVTDPSVQRLLEAAFSEDPSSTLRLETSTIELVSNVNATLTTASAVLGQIRRELGSTASTLGQKTIADLESSASLVSSSLSSLAGDIDTLSSQMSSEMERASADTVAQFESTIGSMKTLLGDPRDFDTAPAAKRFTCDQELPDPRQARSITEQMIAVTAQLSAIASATEDCEARIRQGLADAIGTVDDDQLDRTVIGSLRRTQAELQGQAAALDDERRALKEEFGGSLLGRFGRSLSDLAGIVLAIRNKAVPISGGDDDRDVPDVDVALRDMDRILEDLQAQLADGSELMGALEDIREEAGAELAALESTAVADRVVDQAAELCSLGRQDDGSYARGYDEISRELTGADCSGAVAPGGREDALGMLATQVERTRTTLSEIQGLADPALLEGVTDQLQAVRDMIEQQLDQEPPSRNDLRSLLRSIRELADEGIPYFGEGAPVWPMPKDVAVIADPDPESEECRRVTGFTMPTIVPGEEPDGYVAPDPLEIMMLFYGKVACQQADMDADIDRAFDASIEVLTALSGGEGRSGVLDDHAVDIDRARQVADQQVAGLVDLMTSALDDSARSIRTQGRATIARRTRQLDTERDQLSSTLDRQVAGSLRRIAGTVDRSNRNLVAAERALSRDLDEVLLDLGTREADGTGLLGALVKGAADTGTATDGVLRANAATSEFAGVRSTALADVFLQQAQLSRSLELLEGYPAFGMELPAGSSHLTVFTFRIGKE